MAVKVARIPKFRVNFLTSQYFGEVFNVNNKDGVGLALISVMLTLNQNLPNDFQ